MEKKGGKPIFGKVFIIIIIIVLINLGYFVYKSNTFSNGMTGFSIKTTFYVVKDTVSDNYSKMPLILKLLFVLQWVVLLAILIYAFFKDLIFHKNSSQAIQINIKKSNENNKTDLDILYETLRENKELSLSSICTSFGISKEIALDWCNILETAELVTVQYPNFGEPIVKFKEKDIKIINMPKQEEIIKDTKEIKAEVLKISNLSENKSIEEIKIKEDIKKINKKILKIKKKR